MFDIEFLKEIESTSTWARLNLESLPDFKIISADYQTNGHGQFDRKWLSSSKNGGNCYISIVLKPQNIEHLGELTQYTSSIVADVLTGYGLKPKFKYPNDVLIEDRKIAGILAESVFMGNTFKGVVVGIGVNLNLDKDEISQIDAKVTSIYNETRRNIDKLEFISKLLNQFKSGYEEFLIYGRKIDV